MEVVGKAAKALERRRADAGLALLKQLKEIKWILIRLETKMKEAAKKLDFEDAA